MPVFHVYGVKTTIKMYDFEAEDSDEADDIAKEMFSSQMAIETTIKLAISIEGENGTEQVWETTIE